MKQFKLSDKYIEDYCREVRRVLANYTMEAEKEEDLYGYFGPAGITGLIYEPGHLEFVAECRPRYDPHDWNDYPDTEPPKDIVMFVILKNEFWTTAIYKGDGTWKSANPDKDEIIDNVVRFRPFSLGCYIE